MREYTYLANLDLIRDVLNDSKIKIGKTNDNLNELLLVLDFLEHDKTIFVVLPTISEASKYYDDLQKYLNQDDVLFFPADELITAEMLVASNDFLLERLETLITLTTGKKKVVVTNLNGIMKREVPLDIFKDSIITLNKGDEFSRDMLTKKLNILGYSNVYTTIKTGEFSRRGEIIDIYLFGEEKPVRLDFFDDEIESIKYFDPETQISTEEITSITIKPVREFIYSDDALKRAINEIHLFLENEDLTELEKELINKDIVNLNTRTELEKLMRYLTFFYEKKTGLLDYAINKKVYFIDGGKINEVNQNILLDLNEYAMRLGGYALLKLEPYIDIKTIQPDVTIEGLRSIGKLDYSLDAIEVPDYKASGKMILADLKRVQDIRNVLISVTNNELLEKLKYYFFQNGLFYNEGAIYDPRDESKIFFTDIPLPSVMLKNVNLYIINEHSLMDVEIKKRAPKYKSIYKNAIKISKYDELNIGDYIVHYDYGIGKYLGIKTMKNNGVSRDYLYVMYANNSSLYVPVESISSIMKYASKDVPGVKLNEIGGTAWARTKASVRKKIRDISDKLVKLYASRNQAEGFAFPPDDPDQAIFEAEFDYELTKDQKEAVEAIKRDMESSHPMDRLVCGDVGYGKTEVALRAAFKAVYGGKQVAMLAPTTILTKQHYNTFKNRMDKYGIRVELLNRFVPLKEQRAIIEGIKAGSVDIVIGTHKLLSKDIVFKDLGLLIVDEEQRFGVAHKERIKEMKVNVDCITLSATPIPRTLQMSMLGIKDLSMIETPPKNRYPIQTYVLARSKAVIRDAIERELARGGQVFYLYNRVDGIEECALEIQDLVPSAKIVVAHGKLSAQELEKRVYDFSIHKYNVLVCTTIIETGIDIPETNTLLINDADRLGLAQLYQIRGRVGRSSKIAYAYLMYTPHKMLTDEAEKRLEAIKEFNELGSGFKIAMRDLSIRGSGDLLGAEQSGFIESVGLEMYMKILNEEIKHEEAPAKKVLDPSIQAPILSMTVNERYINNESVRLEIHKKIDKLKTLQDLEKLLEELTDRFGMVDDETLEYMWEKLFKAMIKRFGFTKLEKDVINNYILIMDPEYSANINGQKWFLKIRKYPRLNLRYSNPNVILFGKNNKDVFGLIKDIVYYLNDLENN